MSRGSSVPSDERGFTLPELMIVIVLMGILAAIAIPSWFGLVEARKVESAANQVAADMRLAHSSSVNRLGTASVYFDAASFTSTVKCNGVDLIDYCLVRPVPDGGKEAIPGRLPDGVGIRIWNISSTSAANDSSYVSGAGRAVDFSSSGSSGTRGTLDATSTTCPSGPTSGTPTIVVASENDNGVRRCLKVIPATSKVQVD